MADYWGITLQSRTVLPPRDGTIIEGGKARPWWFPKTIIEFERPGRGWWGPR